MILRIAITGLVFSMALVVWSQSRTGKQSESGYHLRYQKTLKGSQPGAITGELRVSIQSDRVVSRRDEHSLDGDLRYIRTENGLFILNQQAKTFTEAPPPSSGAVIAHVGGSGGHSVLESASQKSRHQVGRQVILGRPATMWQVEETSADERPYVWRFIEDDQLGIPLSIDRPGEYTYEVTQIRVGKQPSSSFVVPPDYTPGQ